MALRFRRSFKLAPGIRLNLSGGGASLSVGPRGASVNFGKRGTYLNAGIPGTGLSSRTRLNDQSPSNPASPAIKPGQVSISAAVIIEDDGSVKFQYADGTPLDDTLINKAKRQHGDAIRAKLSETAETINAEVDALTRIHWVTPPPDATPQYERKPFSLPPPEKPANRPVSLWALLTGKKAVILADNREAQTVFELALADWNAHSQEHSQSELLSAKAFEQNLRCHVDFMEQQLEQHLLAIEWPRETTISFELARLDALRIDVDMPEIEDLPSRAASVLDRGYKLTLREIKGRTLQGSYARHVSSVGIRVIGEAFATLPGVNTIVLSALTQRTAPRRYNAERPHSKAWANEPRPTSSKQFHHHQRGPSSNFEWSEDIRQVTD